MLVDVRCLHKRRKLEDMLKATPLLLSTDGSAAVGGSQTLACSHLLSTGLLSSAVCVQDAQWLQRPSDGSVHHCPSLHMPPTRLSRACCMYVQLAPDSAACTHHWLDHLLLQAVIMRRRQAVLGLVLALGIAAAAGECCAQACLAAFGSTSGVHSHSLMLALMLLSVGHRLGQPVSAQQDKYIV